MTYAIIADDMTGAADVGVEFAQGGWRTRTLRNDWQAEHLRGAEVVVVDTESRAADSAAACAAVQQTVARLQQANIPIIYQKVDSTLRGNLGGEVDAVLTGGGHSLAVVCPAFPAAGRTLIDGVLRVNGTPVAQTPAGRDPMAPVRESHLPTLLSRQTQRPIHHCARPSAGFDPSALAAQWRLLPHGALAVVDAGDEYDLAQIAAAADPHTMPGLLLVGSAGLARPWAAVLAYGRQPQVLVLCGSLHPMARTQLRVLQGQFTAPALILLATPATFSSGATHQAVHELAADAAAWLASNSAAGVLVTGGDTLAALLGALDADGIDLERPLAPGIALGRLAGGSWAGLRIVSKAGGFGDEETLVRAFGYLSGKGE